MKYLFTAAFLLLLCLGVSAQTAYFKISSSAYLNKITGASNGFVSLGRDSNYRAEIIKWDNGFNPEWHLKVDDQSISGASFAKTIQANDGSFYTLLETSQNGGSVVIIKTAANGTLLWQKNYTLPGNSFLLGVCLAKGAGTDNGFIFGSGQCALSNCVVKCDANGVIQWQHQYTHSSANGVITCWSIIPEASGYVITSGYNGNSLWNFRVDATGNLVTGASKAYKYSTMTIIPTETVPITNGYAMLGNYNNSNNNKTEFVAFYDNNLNLTSFNELTVTYDQFILAGITPFNNGQNVVVVGSVYDNNVFYEAIINLSTSGGVVWKKMGGGNTSTSFKNVEFDDVTAWGNRIVSVGRGIYEGAVFSIMDASGNGLCNDVPFNLTDVHPTLSVDNIVPAAGAANVSVIPYNASIINNVFISNSVYCGTIPTDTTVTQDVKETLANNTKIYPNPAADKFTIQYNDAAHPLMVQVTSVEGKLVYTNSINQTINVDTHNWNSGVYSIRLSNGAATTVKKLLVTH